MTFISSRTVRGRCPVCGTERAACGPPSDSHPVDENVEVAVVGGPLQKYEVTLPGGRQTTMKLNEADARRYGVLEEDADQAAEPEQEATAAKARTLSRNKARTAANKDGGTGGGD